MSSGVPPWDTATIITPENAAPACVGSPFSATLPLNSGFSRSFTFVIGGTLDESNPIDM